MTHRNGLIHGKPRTPEPGWERVDRTDMPDDVIQVDLTKDEESLNWMREEETFTRLYELTDEELDDLYDEVRNDIFG
jgi:uncharacterized protein YjiS (DUF1127 family)